MRLPTWLLGVGLALVAVGERVLALPIVSWCGALAVGGATLAVAREWRRAGPARAVHRVRLLAYLAVDAALLVYGASTEAALDRLGVSVDHPLERALGLAWPATMLTGLLVLGAVEARARELEPIASQIGEGAAGRLKEAAAYALAVALAVVGAAGFVVAAKARDVRVDLSYLKVTEPSETTLRMVRGLGEPVRVVLFYPDGNEVYERIAPYFERLSEESPSLTVERIDHALAPSLVSRHRIDGNGWVALVRGSGDAEQAEKIQIGNELASSRSALRTLDGRFQEAFSRLVQPRREVHLTVGHDERKMSGEEPAPERLEFFVRQLRRSNIVARELGLAAGLADVTPERAPLVTIAGPRRPFAPEEMQALTSYLRRGGRLLIMVDHDAASGLDPLLADLGLRLLPGTLASERHHVPRTHEAADRRRIYTTRFSNHPTVRSAQAQLGRSAVVFASAAALEPLAPLPPQTRVVFPLRSEADTWRDLDDDLQRDPDEPEDTFRLMAAVTVHNPAGPEGRAVVIGESVFAGNELAQYRGNFRVLGDSLQWLLADRGDEVRLVVGETTTEEDQPMEYDRDEDAIVFYATSFAVPVPLLVLGLLLARQRRRRRGEAGDASPGEEPRGTA